MKKLITICAVVTIILAVSGAAQASLSWQTTPILGTDVSSATGDVVVITGPQPLDGSGNPYHDVDNNVVLGPTIPHYSMVGDPLYGVGSPSMTEFVINPDTYEGGHWVDKVTKIAFGSGINVEQGHDYTFTETWNFLESGSEYTVGPFTGNYAAGTNEFVMLHNDNGLSELWLEDIGSWSYTQTWTDDGTTAFITDTSFFEVVPEPATIGLLSFGALSLFRRKRK